MSMIQRRLIFYSSTVLIFFLAMGCDKHSASESESVKLAKAESRACFSSEPNKVHWCTKNEVNSNIRQACLNEWLVDDQIIFDIVLQYDEMSENRCFDQMTFVQKEIQKDGCAQATKSPIGSYESANYIVHCFGANGNLIHIEGVGPGSQPFKFIVAP